MSLNKLLEPPAELQQIDADPNGDIMFLVGTPDSGVVSMRVCSKVLSLASSAFAAMFSPRWSEGKEDSSLFGVPREIALPDEDTEAMTWICRALHFHKDTSEDVDLQLLEDVALISDKYDLAFALKPWVDLRLQSFRHTTLYSMDERDLSMMMYVASVFGNHDVFWMSSLKLLYACPSNFSKVEAGVDPTITYLDDKTFGMFFQYNFAAPWYADLLIKAMIESVVLERESTIADLQQTLETMISPLLADGGDPFTVTHHLQQIQAIDLWPGSKAFSATTIKVVLDKLRHYQACDRVHCGCSKASLMARVKSLVGRVRVKQQGLCLSCHKIGKVSREKGNCMASQATFCGTDTRPPLFLPF